MGLVFLKSLTVRTVFAPDPRAPGRRSCPLVQSGRFAGWPTRSPTAWG